MTNLEQNQKKNGTEPKDKPVTASCQAGCSYPLETTPLYLYTACQLSCMRTYELSCVRACELSCMRTCELFCMRTYVLVHHYNMLHITTYSTLTCIFFVLIALNCDICKFLTTSPNLL
ncbi:hypothetical protein OTU49_015086 [Cherax quadricarinatus]|uniref:Uncharacterized protein n=1 Tax=Cherax quadricarinatus TaxID=27406 RepID=A0AAW0Y2F1_CHEQU